MRKNTYFLICLNISLINKSGTIYEPIFLLLEIDFYVHEYFVCVCINVHVVPTDGRKCYWIPKNWSYRYW